MSTPRMTRHIEAPAEQVHEGIPAGVSPADNEIGWRMALAKLAALVEQR